MSEKILGIYRAVLDSAGMAVDGDGFISGDIARYNPEAKNTPILINGKRLVLPMPSRLRDADSSKCMFFHPLTENIMRGESDVLMKLRSQIVIRLNYTVNVLMAGLLDIIASTDTHKTLSPDQSQLLNIAPEADQKTVTTFTNIFQKCLHSGETPAVNLFLKRGGIVAGKKYSRVGIVSFPAYEELVSDKDTCFGIKMRKKDRQSFINLYKYIFNKIDQKEGYNVGSDSGVAPFLDALMQTYGQLASNLNDVINLFLNKIDAADKLIIGSDWVDDFQDLNVLVPEIRKIPTQPGNEGSTRLDQQTAPPVAQAVVTPPPTPYVTPAAPQVPVMPVQQPMQPQMPWQPVVQPMQQQLPTGPQKTASGKVDFTTIPVSQTMPVGFIPPSMMTPGMVQYNQMRQPNNNGLRGDWSNTFNNNGFSGRF